MHFSAHTPPNRSATRTPKTEELAKETQNPISNLISVPFQDNFNFGVGPNDATQWILNFQPVIPITLNKDWNLITGEPNDLVAQIHPPMSLNSSATSKSCSRKFSRNMALPMN